ncbi:MAG: CBS domain-containing protein, partial [Gammaproteobacteria bacterium]|nr:CBS domain-containing protein [Gammaproteobacteria bacterium]
RALIAKNHSEAYVADEDGNYAGMLTLNQLLSVKSGNAGELARDDSLRFDAAMSVWDAMEAMRGFVGESIPVLDARGRLLGVVHESALVAAYLRTVRELRAEENADH